MAEASGPNDGAPEPVDPLTALAEAATATHELFMAYIDAGFTRAEALVFIVAVIQRPTS